MEIERNSLLETIITEGERKKVLVSYKNFPEKFFARSFIYFLLLLLLGPVCVLFSLTGLKIFDIIAKVFLVIIVIIYPIRFVYGWFLMAFLREPYIRSKSGEELNEKLEGLKNYLKEYSLLKDKKSEDVFLWEDYLIYSVIFNQNKNIISEYKKYYI